MKRKPQYEHITHRLVRLVNGRLELEACRTRLKRVEVLELDEALAAKGRCKVEYHTCEHNTQSTQLQATRLVTESHDVKMRLGLSSVRDG